MIELHASKMTAASRVDLPSTFAIVKRTVRVETAQSTRVMRIHDTALQLEREVA